jgi:hypothetical protein
VGSAQVLWAETPDDESTEVEGHADNADVDESFAARKLRRWLRGMFGGRAEPKDKPEEDDGV